MVLIQRDTWDILSPVSRSNRKAWFSLRSKKSPNRFFETHPWSSFNAIHGTSCHQYRDRIEKRGFRFDPKNPQTDFLRPIHGPHSTRYMGRPVTSIAIESKSVVFASIQKIPKPIF